MIKNYMFIFSIWIFGCGVDAATPKDVVEKMDPVFAFEKRQKNKKKVTTKDPIVRRIVRELLSEELIGVLYPVEYLRGRGIRDMTIIFEIGLQYLIGSSGLQKCYSTAFRLIEVSAIHRNIEAQAQLGFLYYYGFGVKQNKEEGLQWSREAAIHGNEKAKQLLEEDGWARTRIIGADS